MQSHTKAPRHQGTKEQEKAEQDEQDLDKMNKMRTKG